MMEADGEAQNGDQNRFSPSSSVKKVEGISFFFDALAAVAVGALPSPSRSERCMTSDHVPYDAGNVATPEVYGRPS